jgi:plasmid stability protein
MSNLTIAVDDNIIKQARVRAIQQGTSVSAKVREFLASYVSGVASATTQEPTSDLMRLMEQVRNEIRSNGSTENFSAESGNVAAVPALTLREEMYQGDFRARDRIQVVQGSSLGTGTR